jgi:Arc/MetJ-type ribon-helix-helix transcriptional regulator
MTIHLPKDVESSINAAVLSGHFASVDDAMTEAAHLLLQKLNQGQSWPKEPAASEGEAATKHKPIWEEIEEITASVPDEEFLKLPVDGAEQHDHYIYGTPKRPPAQ